ncbi:MAG: hypothetical protein WC781_00645 [Candidatus Pacearchaeota archaeon]
MKAKIKKFNEDGVVRLETSGEIKEMMISQDIMAPGKDSVDVCFKGINSSGIISFKPEEIERLYNTLQKKNNLIKGFGKILDKSDY